MRTEGVRAPVRCVYDRTNKNFQETRKIIRKWIDSRGIHDMLGIEAADLYII